MKTSQKTAIIVAVSLVSVGLILSLGALVAMGFDFTSMNTLTFVTNTYSVAESFTDISVEGAECDIRLLLSDDDSCKVICSESDKIAHSVTVKNDTLTIKRVDDRKWYDHIGIYWGKMEVIIYLPQREYESLSILSLSGDIEIPKDFSFSEAEIRNTSGDVRFSAAVNNDLYVKTVSGELYVGDTKPKNLNVQSTSGDVTIAWVKAGLELTTKTVSGNIDLIHVECQNVTAESSSGEIVFSAFYALKNIHIESVSGDVALLECDAESLWIKTTSGEVTGTLLTEKIFIADTSSGHIHVPQSNTGGKCEIKTTSGDIEFKIK